MPARQHDGARRVRVRRIKAHINRGNALKDLGRPDEANASYDKASGLDSRYTRRRPIARDR